MIEIRYVKETDKDFWFRLDRHISKDELDRKIRDKMGYVLFENDLPVGVLRYGLFWDSIPFCNLIYIEESYQKKGYGSALMEYWEADMKRQGYEVVMTSTQSDEEAQHFYRKIGYKENGNMIFNISGYEQPMEMLFIKDIR